MARDMICITCPIGCRLRVERNADGSLSVAGNGCARGLAYAQAELSAPARVVTACVRAGEGKGVMLPCKTGKPFPMELIPRLLGELRLLRPRLPVKTGDPLLRDALGTGIDVVATKSIPG